MVNMVRKLNILLFKIHFIILLLVLLFAPSFILGCTIERIHKYDR